MQIIAATGNSGKLKEFTRILSPMGFTVLSLEDMDMELEIEENGSSFAENAAIKARAVHEITGKAVIADDSGLCVDALDGRPGIYSARYGGHGMAYSEKIKNLLYELRDVPDEKRTAAFECAIVVVLEDGSESCFTGECKGKIGYEVKGDGGFGYDPIFYVGEQSMAELSDSEKDKISHRGKALIAMTNGMTELCEK